MTFLLTIVAPFDFFFGYERQVVRPSVAEPAAFWHEPGVILDIRKSLHDLKLLLLIQECAQVNLTSLSLNFFSLQ